MWYILILTVAACLGLIPANIAQKKGYSFALWWLYGWMLFIVAIIHVSLIPDKNTPNVPSMRGYSTPYRQTQVPALSAADELKKFKELLDQGIINEAEFAAKKQQLIKFL